MDDRINIRVLFEDGVKRLLVCDIELRKLGSLATDEFDTVENLIGGIVQVVSDDYFVASFKERKGGERTNIAGSTTSMVSVEDEGVEPQDVNTR